MTASKRSPLLMDPRNPNPNTPPPSMRVLTRPPAGPTLPPSAAPDPRPPDGVVVVGFISRSSEASSQLINRVLDSNAFGSGRLDKPIFPEDKEEKLREWFRHRRISYYHEEDKGVVFLQLSATRCPVVGGLTGQSSGLYPFLDNWEFEELQGMIFMFSVCHVILFIHEGSDFDTQVMKKLRVLQAAKNSLAPYVRSRAAPPFPSRPNSLSNSGKRTTLAGSSPGRGGGMISRNASAVSLMSGLGSNTSLFPGHCTPVLLFVFVDEFPDVADPSSSLEESTDNSSLNPSSNVSSLARPNLPAKGSGPVVMLARPGNKSEGGLRKKLQSALEAQIRFLIKRCRILTGSESGHTGSRTGAVSSSTPLFSLDTSRAVALLDRCSVQRTESLEFAIELVEDVLNGKATSEIFLLESHAQSSNKEDILMIKDFIHRQSDMVRGRGGLVTGTNSGSAAGVGMVAVAAAAAAASAASGKAFATPELPTLETWLSSSKVILNGVLSAKGGCIDDTEFIKRKPNQRNSSPAKVEGVALKGADPIDVAVSQLESGRGLITKFSMSWCEKALPTAMDVYLKDLPACYPTSQHEARLEKALHSFHSMVRGPAVKFFAKKLEDDCMSIWKSGRQQCDAVSLTRKPCIYQRHEVTNGETACSPVDSHSSGYFFLHACACGRSRQLRPDPFDMESANVGFNCFAECDKLLPVVQLPEDRSAKPVQSSSWKLLRVGGAAYYEPSKGLLQSGFSAKQRFLLKWTISPYKSRSLNTLLARNLQQDSLNMSGIDPDIVGTEIDIKRSGVMRLQWGNIQNGLENQREMSEKSQIDDKKISFGAGVPNFTMRKPFAEVVAGSSSPSDSFPPLKQRKQASSSSEKSVKQNKAKNYREQIYMAANQTSTKSEDNPSGKDISIETSNGVLAHDPLVRIGSNAIPVSIISGETEKSGLSEPAFVYVGFEHECPRGHRFLLNPDQLNELETLYPLTESSTTSFDTSDPSLVDPSNSKNSNDKVDRSAKSMVVNSSSKLKAADRSKGVLANGVVDINGMVKLQGYRKEPDQASTLTRADSHSLENVHVELHRLKLDDGGSVFNMLNRDLPIYMNCPYCKKSKDKKDDTKIKFADAVSQLQRIFLVTPPFPVVLATCPVIQFKASCLPKSIPERDKRLQFSFGCPVILPPESFITLRLPFVYGTQLEDGSLHPLKALDSHPETTAWIEKGTAIQVLSKKSSVSERPQTV